MLRALLALAALAGAEELCTYSPGVAFDVADGPVQDTRDFSPFLSSGRLSLHKAAYLHGEDEKACCKKCAARSDCRAFSWFHANSSVKEGPGPELCSMIVETDRSYRTRADATATSGVVVGRPEAKSEL